MCAAHRYIKANYDAEWLPFLQQAYELSALVLVVDGIDEASGKREAVGALIQELSIAFRIVATSRPEGVEAQ